MVIVSTRVASGEWQDGGQLELCKWAQLRSCKSRNSYMFSLVKIAAFCCPDAKVTLRDTMTPWTLSCKLILRIDRGGIHNRIVWQ